MTKIALMIGAAALTMLVSACADDQYAYGPAGYSADAAYVGGPYDVWYDGYYGPYAGGYWDGGVFMFPDGHGGFTRDTDGHFRNESFGTARGFRSHRD